MKNHIALLAVMVIAFTVSTSGQQKKKDASEAVVFKNRIDTVSYIIGADIGQNMKRSKIELNEKSFMLGLGLGYRGADTLISREEIDRVMQQFQAEMEEKQNNEQQTMITENKSKGAEFCREYKSKPGVIEGPEGLLYRILKEGSGDKPLAADTVSVYYRGRLLSGEVFDETKAGEPVSFPLGNLIRGWTLGIQMMQVGSTFEFVIPSELGYGDREVGPIPAGSTLIFEVELLGIKKGN